MSKRIDVTALGELLIDFTENGTSGQGNPIMEANPGGAPCNVLAMLTRLGHSTAFIGKVGDDMFGTQLEAALEEVGISREGLIKDPVVHTTLAFVHTYPDGDRDFSFYRKPGADMMLSVQDINESLCTESTIFHFGSLSMTDPICEEATLYAVKKAKEAGAIITYDPNLREPLWESLDKAAEKIAQGMELCDVMKISDNEIQWFTGEQDFETGVRILQEKYPNIKLLLLSLGKDGSLAYSKSAKAFAPAVIRENTIETTGAGDTFCGCVLHYILENGLKDYTEAELTDMLTFANKAASIITTKKGALRVMPTIEEIQNS